jgi:hypothetical protein
MRINNRFGLALTLVVATAITATPAKADPTATPATQTIKSNKIVPAGTTKINPQLNDKIKVIQPGGGIQGTSKDFHDKNPPFAQAPTFGESGGGAFVNFKKDTPGAGKLNPAQKINPSAVKKMQKIQTNGR